MESGEFDAIKIGDFSALSAVFPLRRARLTGNPPSVSDAPACEIGRTANKSNDTKATTMTQMFFGRRRSALMAALGISVGALACYAASVHARPNTQLQDIADNAALAGVNSLAASAGQPADARSAAAMAAARTAAAAQSGVIRTLQPSVDGLTMSIVMEDVDKGTRVSSTARYIPAKDGQPARQAINLSGYTAAAL